MRELFSHSICLALLAAISTDSARAQYHPIRDPAERVLSQIDCDESSRPSVDVSEPVVPHLLVDDALIPQAEFNAPEFGAAPRHDVYHRRQWSISYLTGFSGINLGPAPVPFSTLPEIVRFNRVFNDPRSDRFLKGSFEWLFEIDTLPVVNGPASIVIGGSALLRYNFRTFNRNRLVFYGQAGGGGVYTDAYLYRRGVLSTGFEFIIDFGCGCNYFLTDRLALNLEFSYMHLSNSGIKLPNIGVNELGGLVGFTYYFRRRRSP